MTRVTVVLLVGVLFFATPFVALAQEDPNEITAPSKAGAAVIIEDAEPLGREQPNSAKDCGEQVSSTGGYAGDEEVVVNRQKSKPKPCGTASVRSVRQIAGASKAEVQFLRRAIAGQAAINQLQDRRLDELNQRVDGQGKYIHKKVEPRLDFAERNIVDISTKIATMQKNLGMDESGNYIQRETQSDIGHFFLGTLPGKVIIVFLIAAAIIGVAYAVQKRK